MTPADTVTLKGMRFHARIGVLPHEAHVSQPIEVDVSAEVEPMRRAPDVVDYSRLYDVVAAVVGGHRISYLEDAAERVARDVLGVPGVQVAHVAVRKPHAALPGPIAYAEVSITRRRSG